MELNELVKGITPDNVHPEVSFNKSQLKKGRSIEPCGYRVLILPDKVDEKTAGGIYLPEQTQDREQFRQMISTVVAIGEFAFQDYPGQWYKPGDRVITKEYPGVIIKDPDNEEIEYRLINDVDVLAKIK